jgi:hypothetical protein
MVEKGFTIYDFEAGIIDVHSIYPKEYNYKGYFAGGDVENYTVAYTCNCGDYGAKDAGSMAI